MNIVTMCRGGNVRSVAAKLVLQKYLGHEVIAIGADNTSPETKKVVFDWADHIVVMSSNLLEFLKLPFHSHREGNYIRNYTHKSILLDVGNDVWGDPFAEGLHIYIADMFNHESRFKAIRGTKQVPYLRLLDDIKEYKAKIKLRNQGDSSL